MRTGLAFLALFLVAGAASAQDPPPPPPPLEDWGDPLDPEADPEDPTPTDPNPAEPSPYYANPEPDPAPKPPPGYQRWSGCMVFGVQTLAGVGVCCAANFIPGGYCAAPAATGFVQAWIGDRYGDSRGSAVVPMVTNYMVSAVAGVGIVGSYIALASGAFGFNFDITNPAVIVLLGSSMLAFVIAPMMSAATYHMFAEPKREGDFGQGDPGMTKPNHPRNTKPKPPPGAGPQYVMRY